jgi:hypothetical protein
MEGIDDKANVIIDRLPKFLVDMNDVRYKLVKKQDSLNEYEKKHTKCALSYMKFYEGKEHYYFESPGDTWYEAVIRMEKLIQDLPINGNRINLNDYPYIHLNSFL